jgi:hypothetical protein
VPLPRAIENYRPSSFLLSAGRLSARSTSDCAEGFMPRQ